MAVYEYALTLLVNVGARLVKLVGADTTCGTDNMQLLTDEDMVLEPRPAVSNFTTACKSAVLDPPTVAPGLATSSRDTKHTEWLVMLVLLKLPHMTVASVELRSEPGIRVLWGMQWRATSATVAFVVVVFVVQLLADVH